MTCEVIFEITIRPECADALLKWLERYLPASRAYPGCMGLSVAQNEDDSNEIVFIQTWESRSHYDTFMDWRKQTGVFAELLSLADGEPKLRFLDFFEVK